LYLLAIELYILAATSSYVIGNSRPFFFNKGILSHGKVQLSILAKKLHWMPKIDKGSGIKATFKCLSG